MGRTREEIINHGSIKPGFTIKNDSIDKGINIYSDRHIFEHNA